MAGKSPPTDVWQNRQEGNRALTALVFLLCATTVGLLGCRRTFSHPRMNVQGALWEATNAGEQGQLPPEMTRVIPEGYFVQGIYQGDLNEDDRDDYVMLVALRGEDTLAKRSNRPIHRALLLILAQPDGSFGVACRNDRVVYCSQCGGVMGDPLEEIKVDSGKITVQQYGGSAWRWSRTTRFVHDKERKAWYLALDSTESYHIAQPDDVSHHSAAPVELGKVRFEDFDVYKPTEI